MDNRVDPFKYLGTQQYNTSPETLSPNTALVGIKFPHMGFGEHIKIRTATCSTSWMPLSPSFMSPAPSHPSCPAELCPFEGSMFSLHPLYFSLYKRTQSSPQLPPPKEMCLEPRRSGPFASCSSPVGLPSTSLLTYTFASSVIALCLFIISLTAHTTPFPHDAPRHLYINTC